MRYILPFLILLPLKSFALDCSQGAAFGTIKYLQCYYRCEDDVECKRLELSIKRDSKASCLAKPQEVESPDRYIPWLQENTKAVQGRVSYRGVMPGRYGYWLYSRNQTLTLHTTIHF